MTRISVIGLGKLGIPMAVAMASKGHKVIGLDVVEATVAAINTKESPIIEPGVQELLNATRKRNLRVTMDYRDAVMNTDISFVIVPTPSDDRGYFDIRYAQAAFRSIGAVLKEKKDHHTVVLTSTVMPGSTTFGCLPHLVEASKKRPGADFSLCYSPEFIALGSVIHDFLNPDILLIGEFDKQSGDILEMAYADIMDNSPPVHRMSIENAELAKIALNSYITQKITYANVIGAICEKIPGGDCDKVLGAVGADSRVGKKYLRAGLGYGGPCFPRDNVALASFARDVGVSARMMTQTDAVNEQVPWNIRDSVWRYLVDAPSVLILGTSYKPFSPLIEESQAFELARIVAQSPPVAAISERRVVYTWDPVAPCSLHSIGETNRKKPHYADYSHIIIANNDPAFADLTADKLSPGTVVIDLWRSHTHLADNPVIRYVPLGRCRNDQMATMRLVKGMQGVVE